MILSALLAKYRSSLIIGGAALVVVLVAASLAHYWRGRAEDLQAKLATANASLAIAIEANESNQTLITEQRLSIETWKQRTFYAKWIMEAAVKNASLAMNRLEATSKRLDAEERQDDALPDCAQLRAVDLASVCPATARSLRQRSDANR